MLSFTAKHAPANGELAVLLRDLAHCPGEIPTGGERRAQVGEPPADCARSGREVAGVDVGGFDGDEQLAHRGAGPRAGPYLKHIGLPELGHLADADLGGLWQRGGIVDQRLAAPSRPRTAAQARLR